MNPHTHEWSEQVDAADAFVFVTPEYNHGYPASLKNAIDYLHHEWRYKPVGFVSYGGVAAGTRSVEQLQQVVTAVKLYAGDRAGQHPVLPAVHRGRRGPRQRGDGGAAVAMLDQLVKLEALLRPVRDEARAAA